MITSKYNFSAILAAGSYFFALPFKVGIQPAAAYVYADATNRFPTQLGVDFNFLLWDGFCDSGFKISRIKLTATDARLNFSAAILRRNVYDVTAPVTLPDKGFKRYTVPGAIITPTTFDWTGELIAMLAPPSLIIVDNITVTAPINPPPTLIGMTAEIDFTPIAGPVTVPPIGDC